MQTYVVSPKCTSSSARALAKALGIKYIRIREYTSSHAAQRIINWGCSNITGNIILNNPTAIQKGINKLTTFTLLNGKILVPDFSICKAQALRWIADGDGVVIRSCLRESQSRGVLITGDPSIVQEREAKLYTKYIHHVNEIRINCYKNKVVSVYNKIVNDEGVFDFKFIKEAEKNVPSIVQNMLSNIYATIGLDIYGLDVLITEEGDYYFLETNSAPILFPITCSRYASLIKKEFFHA